MKKITLLLSIIGATLFMSSCLEDGETAYSGVPLSYITTSEMGVTYALTIEGLPITSPEIKMEYPGTFVYIDYSWSESQNTITEEGIHNATVNKISDPLDQATLNTVDAPELETELPLGGLQNVGYGGVYFGYHWILAYSYEKGDGTKKAIKFYHNIEEGSENEVIVDVRLENTIGTVDKDQTDVLVAVNFKQLNDYYAAEMSNSDAQKNLKVYFRYWIEKSDGTLEEVKTPQYYLMPIMKK